MSNNMGSTLKQDARSRCRVWCGRAGGAIILAVVGLAGVPAAVAQDAIPDPEEIARPGSRPLPPRETREAPAVTPRRAPAETAEPQVSGTETEPGAERGPVFAVSGVDLTYARSLEGLPPLGEVAAATVVSFSQLPTGLAAPRPDAPTVQIPLDQLGRDEPVQLHVSAIRAISESLVRTLNQRGLGGVFVFPDPQQFDDQLNDIRKDQQLDMIVSLEVVTSAKTTATGPRFEGQEPLENRPEHARILSRSPIQPYTPQSGGGLLQIDALDEYALFLNRHPGRRVDVAVTADETSETPGAEMEYLVYESRPWRIYAQTSNTGTDSTNNWRTQLGYANYQLTDHDDILTLDYITAGFDASHSVLLSYDAPLPNLPRVRWQINGAWSDYVASELGPFQDDFSGTTWTAGGQLSWNFFQDGPLLVDAIGGLRWQNLQVNNELFGAESDVNFVEMDFGLSAQEIGETRGWSGSATLNWSVDVDGDLLDLTILGRSLPDDDWLTLQWGVSGYWYLEPLLNRRAWEDPSTPGSTLAHELAASFRGQYAFDYRLVPQKQQVAGGFYTVRGYDEAATVGDTTLIGTLEYRFHLPRTFTPESEPGTIPVIDKPFRYSPDQPYGRADWDLIFRAFLDVGRTINSDPLFFEEDHTLVGTGVGLELVVLQNFSARMDWGVALRDLDTGDEEVDAGDSRFHFVFTLLY